MSRNVVIQINTICSSFASIALWLLISLIILVSYGCVAKKEQPLIEPVTAPFFFDDYDNHSLITALNHHLDYLKGQKNSYGLNVAGNYYSNRDLQESLQLFLEIIRSNPSTRELNRKIYENFSIYQAAGRKGYASREMLITGYFEPVLEGSLTRTGNFRYPIYGIPDSLVIQKSTQNNKNQIGRFDRNNSFVSYWSRKEIEQLGVARGFERVYLNDPLDAFLLHVQGSGTILLNTGEIRKIRYAISNGHEYNSIGKLLVDEGKMSLEDASIPAIRKYLQHHPEEQQRIFHHNPRFIFFQWERGKDVIGSLGKPLTPGRSIAIDQGVLPAGLVGYVMTRKPSLDKQGNIGRWWRMRRFVMPQDSGSAIQGSGRADIFWGNGRYAETAAGNMKEKGSLFFLVKKKRPQ